MDEADYVETSDPEELEIIQGSRNARLATPLHATLSWTTPNLQMPRKRRKFFHENNDHDSGSGGASSSSERSMSQGIHDGSTTPVHSSPALPTSTAVSDVGRCDPTASLSFKELHVMDRTEREENGIDPFLQVLSVNAVSMDIAYDEHNIGSQDELDVISQSLSQAEIGSGDRSPSSRTPGLRHFPSSDDQVAHEVMNTDGREASDQHFDSFSLFASQLVDTSNRVNAGLNGLPNSTPMHSPIHRPRYPSLPPSSPPQTLSSIPNTPQRALSLGLAGLDQPQSQTHGQDVGTKQLPAGLSENSIQFVDEDEDDIPTRRYSLRARQARQLNPYEYDKRLYKQQMRRMPDAIVKVVSPRRHNSERTHKRHESQEEDEFIISEDETDESQETTRMEKGRRSSDASLKDYEDREKSLTWLPKALHMSHDDLIALSPGVAGKSPLTPTSEAQREAHKFRRRRLRKFPLQETSVRKEDRTERDDRGTFKEVQGAGSKQDDVTQLEQREPLKKLTKKQRHETAQKSTLYTVISHGKKIGSGRKRGFMSVQIDIADHGMRQALKPLRPDSPLQVSHAFDKTTSARFKSGQWQKTYNRGHDGDSKSTLKQTSLHDFASNDGDILDEFPLRVSERRRTTLPTDFDWENKESIRTYTLDMGISAPTRGLAFGASTYLGKQLLRDLIDFTVKGDTPTRPSSYEGFGLIDLHAEMTFSCFVEAMGVASNVLSEWLDEEAAGSTDEDNVRRYEHLMHSICQFSSWVYSSAGADGKESVEAATSFCAGKLTEKVREKVGKTSAALHCLDLRCLSVMWFVVELTTRMLAAAHRQGSVLDIACWRESVMLLVNSLIRHGMTKTLKHIETRDMSSSSTSLRTAELWVCLIHLLPQVKYSHDTAADSGGAFWPIILQAVKDDKVLCMSNIEVSEHLWRLVFSLSALSHFSAHGISTSEPRLPPCWEIVGLALDTIRLTHDKDGDSNLPREIIKRRDQYVRMIVARCFVLGQKRNWPLRDAYIMFKKLVDIFKSRNFANLLGEEPEFPAFLRDHNVELLDALRTSDTAFSLYLKLVVQATKADTKAPESDDVRTKARVMKLLSLTVPLSGVAFSKAHPPTTDELPMLINRFSAIVVAVLVDGKEIENLQNRLSQARRFISFVDADDRSRDICIKAAMYMAVVVNHLSLELDDPLSWLGEMCQTLLEEFQNVTIEVQSKGADASKADSIQQLRHRLVIRVHLLLRCVRNIIEMPNMGPGNSTTRYPNIGLLSGPWVKRIFSMKELTNMVSTRLQILQLVQSFLKTRTKVIPPPRCLAPSATSEESSESQDAFVNLGFTDDDLLALIPLDGETEENWKKDKKVAEIMNSDIVPHIFRLLLQYFNDPSACPSDETRLEDFWGNADDWIDCWVGCAAIVVRNEIRSWNHYLSVGPQSWNGISDSFFRRRVAVRFMYQLLKCDASAYKDYERDFLGVFLQSLVAYMVTMENEYLSTLFSVDGLRHIMLRDIPVDRASKQEDFHLTRADFLQAREAIITCVFSNLNLCLEPGSSELEKNVFVQCVVEMLSAMRDIWKNLSSTEDRDKYGDLCRHVFSNIRKHARIYSLSRLAEYMTWGASFDEPSV